MKGLTLQEAQEKWNTDGDVICPNCENHIHEDDKHAVCFGEMYHYGCHEAMERINKIESEQAEVYDPQQD